MIHPNQLLDGHFVKTKNPVEFDGSTLRGQQIMTTIRKVKHMEGVFYFEDSRKLLDPEITLYTVDSYTPVEQGTEGGLFFGITHILPGHIGNEYFMTKGHIHEIQNRSEYYWGIQGEGYLVLKPLKGESWVEKVYPGSLHYIPGFTAHRLVNAGELTLDVGACWPADAGHEYGIIAHGGFGIRVMKGEAGPEIVNL